MWVVGDLFKGHRPPPPEPNKAPDETRDWPIERQAKEAMQLRGLPCGLAETVKFMCWKIFSAKQQRSGNSADVAAAPGS
jgi:hypothetical protein